VALSRARLGLYILGRREVFESCYELREAFSVLFRRPDKLTLVTGELWPAQRLAKQQEDTDDGASSGLAVMEGVEHLGQYVFEMTNAKVEQLKAGRGLPAEAEPAISVEPAVEETEEGLSTAGFEAEES